MYRFLDTFFFVFHTAFIAFILTGWTWRPVRKLHLIGVVLTAFSWFVLGIWYGFGFCFCTDWHWRVRMALGDQDLPNSYIKFLIDQFTGWDVNALYVDAATVVLFLAAFALSICMNVRDRTANSRLRAHS